MGMMADSGSRPNPPSFADKRHAKEVFARRLQHELTIRGMNGSELSRRASAFMPHDKAVSRDNISNYLRGLHLPGEVILSAIAKALGVEPNFLLPDRAVKRVDRDSPKFSMQEIGNGNVLLRVNREVPFHVATKIASTLAELD